MSSLFLIPLFPLIGVLVNGFFGKRLGDKPVGWIGSGVIGLSFLISLKAVINLTALPAGDRTVIQTLYTWVAAGFLSVDVSFLLDPLSAVMLLVVTGVSFVIHIYSIGYMRGDTGFARYFTYLNLFVFSMLLLVLGNNYLVMFVGWEGVGLCSYLLIGFWFHDQEKASAGRKAFIVNRIGDFGFLLGMFLILVTFGSLDFQTVFQGAEKMPVNAPVMTAITLLLFVGAVGKSAQLPLYIWLPDAMAGPTPVSSLIHAATMVTAGVYMVARNNLLYALSPTAMLVVAVTGAATALFAATIGLAQNDIKKVLAYSTISQLGYMFIAVGVGAFGAGIFHLMTHAFFKGLLFLGAGSIIHAVSGEQDMRWMGGLRRRLPVTFWTFFAATLAIAGVPGLSGFFSKDEILWAAFSSERGHILLWLTGFLTAGLTAFYMFRLVFLTFFGPSRVKPEVDRHVHESPAAMTGPLIILAVLSVIGGYIGIPHALRGANHFERFLHPVFSRAHETMTTGDAHHALSTKYLLMACSVGIALLGIATAYVMYLKNPGLPDRLASRTKGLYTLILNKYYVDEIYEAVIVNPCVKLAEGFWKVFDVGVIDGAVNGVADLIQGGSDRLRKIQTGFVQSYALSIVLGIVMILAFYIFG